MSSIEKISIALPREMVAQVRRAVDAGEYASSSEVVRDALREWTQRRSLRQEGLDELRRVWREAVESKAPHVSPEAVFTRLRQRYKTAKKPIRTTG